MLKVYSAIRNAACQRSFSAGRIFIFVFLVAGLFPPSWSLANPDDSYLRDLVGRSHDLKLHEQRYWHLLMHYRSVRDGWESTVDDPKFFLSQQGKNDPRSELEATLAAFASVRSEEQEQARCRFVARYAWLKEQLSIDESKLPPAACTEFKRTLGAINPRSVALIFPVAYLNSPASMFGHTLLRIDGDHDNVLVSQAVNYAAVTEESKGISYAWKGIFGGYPGYYASVPYYEKVKEYSAIEHRDIWEYKLDLSPDEARRIVLHAWEMRGIYSDYYFFDENCSYEVLYLIEVARPSLRLTQAYDHSLKFWVIPSDTVNIVVDSGIISQVTYRPSQATRIQNIAKVLSHEGKKWSYEVANGERTPAGISAATISSEEKSRSLDLAAEYVQFLASRRMINEKEYLGRFVSILKERSTFGQPEKVEIEPVQQIRPEQGHLPFRAQFGGGCRTGYCFGEVGVRPAYHDLMDDDAGYVRGAQINFMDLVLRYNLTGSQLDLYRLRVLDIKSIAPRDIFFRPLSWKFNIGVEQKLIPEGKERLVSVMNGGAGPSFSWGSSLVYVLGEVELNAGSALRQDVAFGAGFSAGMLGVITPSWKYQAEVRGLSPLAGDIYRTRRAELSQNVTLNQNNSISLNVSRQETNSNYRSEMTVRWNHYY